MTSLIEVPSQGPRNARVMVVGEAPGQHEEEQMQPFVGYSGLELTRMMREAGFNRSECYVTNVCRVRPPGNDIKRFFGTKSKGGTPYLGRYPNEHVRRGVEQLEEDIRSIDPDLILACGDTALWSCTGESGITKWRGSVLECRVGPEGNRPKVIPTYHPSAVLRQWSWRNILVEDLRRARRELDRHGRRVVLPDYAFQVRPSFEQTLGVLSSLLRSVMAEPTWIACDIETQRRKIDCVGLAWSKLEAICIPFIQMDTPASNRFYWSVEEQAEIIWRLMELLTHPNCLVIGQNFPYDQQYFARELGFIPNLKWDTMTMHHSIFCTLPKALDFQSSLYCDFHRYWKADAKDAEGHRLGDEDQWVYNARDCVVTFECKEKQEALIASMKFPSRGGMTPQERQMSFHEPMLSAMLRGVQASLEKKEEVLSDINRAMTERKEWIDYVCSHPLNPRSPKQLQAFFYTDMGIKKIINRKTGSPTCDDKALTAISIREPLVAPICEFITDYRSLGALSNVCKTPLDHDNRFRCQYSIPGTDTYRYNSTSDAFRFGTNLQNVSSGTEDMEPEKLAEAIEKGILLKPNLRKLFVPDPGMTMGDFDLPQADAQVVAWEADDELLKAIFRDPDRDLHCENAAAIFGRDAYIIGHPHVPDKKNIRPEARQYAKMGVHACNYAVKARTLAAALNISINQAESFIRAWFAAHPNIADWHNTIMAQIQTRRYIENAFGYRRYCFDRPDNEFKEALAWIPQSTVALVTNTGITNVYRELRTQGVMVLLQVHDSAVYQWPTARGRELAREIQRCMTVPIPYEDPLVMLPGAKFSEKSWGECEERYDWLEEA